MYPASQYLSGCLILLFTPLGLSFHPDQLARQTKINTWTNFSLPKGDQDSVNVNIPAGYIKDQFTNVLQELEQNEDQLSSAFVWRVTVSIDGATTGDPVLVLVKDGKTEKSLKMPYTRTKDRSKVAITAPFSERSFDLCPLEIISKDSILSVTFLSLSDFPVNVQLKVELSTIWTQWKKLEEKKFSSEGVLSLSSPVLRTSLFSPYRVNNSESILIQIETLPGYDSFCSLISIQQPKCPYFDSISSAIRFGTWQTMDESSALQIQADDFPNGYLIVVVAAESDEFCMPSKGSQHWGDRTRNLVKRIRITESVNTHASTTLTAVFVIVSIYVVVVILAISLSCIQFRYNIDLFEGMKDLMTEKNKTSKKCSIAAAIPFVNPSFEFPDIKEPSENKYNGTVDIELPHSNVAMQDTYILNREDVPDPSAVNYSRLKSTLYVSDLSEKLDIPDRSKSVYQKSNLFMGNFLLMSIFYSLAVLQLAFQSAGKQKSSGNNDICYYNSLCQKPLGPFLDFNHFFSNLGYIVFGVIFNCIVYFKQARFEKCKKDNLKNFVENKHGIPHQYGIYYTMGGALAMEGLMSACYHVCPTSISFQFDTTFMYLLAILMYIKLYQNRHPDISSNSLQAYLILGIALILEAISIYYSTPVFWVIFCTIYILSTMMLATNIYNLGAARQDRWLIVHVSRMLTCELKKVFNRMQGKQVPQIRPLLVLLAVTCILNFLLCVYYAVKASSNSDGASNYLLIMFMANMFVYLGYYMIMKFKSGERPGYQTWIYAGCSALCALPAMYFFVKKEKNSELSPAESRDINSHCILLEYFDGHDVWHFLGGAAVFFTFMFIFTIDEDLKYKKRSEIKVF